MVLFIDILNYLINCFLAYQGSIISLNYDIYNKSASHTTPHKYKAVLCGFITAIGGGTIRDILYNKSPSFINDKFGLFSIILFAIIGAFYSSS